MRNRDLFAWSQGDRACAVSKRAAMPVWKSTAVEWRYPASTPASSGGSQGREEEEGCRVERRKRIRYGDSTGPGRGSMPETGVEGRSNFSPKSAEEKAGARSSMLGDTVDQRVAGFDGEESRKEALQ